MASASPKVRIPRGYSKSFKPAVNETGTGHEESRVESESGDSPQSHAGNDRRESEITRPDDASHPSRQQMDTKRGTSKGPGVSEHTSYDMEQMRGMAQQRDKPPHSYEADGARPSKYSQASRRAANQQYPPVRDGPYSSASDGTTSELECAQRHGRGADDSYPQSAGLSRPDDKPSIHNTDVAPSFHTTELRKRYEALLMDHEVVQVELEARTWHLEAMTDRVKRLKVDNYNLQQKYEEQLASVRHELRSCQSQLGNVQGFVSTVDAHSDRDIIQKLQELNEEVYMVSMIMADAVAEGFTHPNVTDNQAIEPRPPSADILVTIGDAMVKHLATMGPDEDIALFLQIAFQAFLSHLLRFTVSSWTIDRNLNTFVEETYQRLRNAETQAISGRWRSLTRTHILPTPAGDPNVVFQHAVTRLSDIVMAAGLLPPEHDVASKLSSEFGQKIMCIVSHAGRFGRMVSEMISGDFEIFAVKSGAPFDGESMVDMTGDTTVPQGAKEGQTVLCVSRVGLRKRMGEKIIIFTKAQVVLESFLG